VSSARAAAIWVAAIALGIAVAIATTEFSTGAPVTGVGLAGLAATVLGLPQIKHTGVVPVPVKPGGQAA